MIKPRLDSLIPPALAPSDSKVPALIVPAVVLLPMAMVPAFSEMFGAVSRPTKVRLPVSTRV